MGIVKKKEMTFIKEPSRSLFNKRKTEPAEEEKKPCKEDFINEIEGFLKKAEMLYLASIREASKKGYKEGISRTTAQSFEQYFKGEARNSIMARIQKKLSGEDVYTYVYEKGIYELVYGVEENGTDVENGIWKVIVSWFPNAKKYNGIVGGDFHEIWTVEAADNGKDALVTHIYKEDGKNPCFNRNTKKYTPTKKDSNTLGEDPGTSYKNLDDFIKEKKESK